MRYDRDFGPRGARPGSFAGRGIYGGAYEGPYPRHGFERGSPGGAPRSRGSWYVGGRRSGNEYDEPDRADEFGWGGYFGGRGYGGTSFDLEHGYATGRRPDSYPPRGARPRDGDADFSWPASRAGYAWQEEEAADEYGPARYGYGPYFERLRRRRRPDDEIRHEVEETLFFDTWVDADAITVNVADGVVTLKGTLPSYEEMRFAVDDAWDVEGVRGVRSDLDVAEGQRQGLRQPRTRDWERHLHGHPEAGESRGVEAVEVSAGQSEPNAGGDKRTGARASGGRSRHGEEAEPAAPRGRGRRSRGNAGANRPRKGAPGPPSAREAPQGGAEAGPGQ